MKGGDRRENVRRALELVREDVAVLVRGNVMLKPNFVSTTSQLATTHVDAIRGVLDFVVGCQADSIAVVEGATGDTWEGFRNFGYVELPSEYPVELVNLHAETDREPLLLLDVERKEKEIGLFSRSRRYHCRISVAVAKTHDTAILTLSLKNMMGCLEEEAGARRLMHGISGSDAPEPPLEKQVKVIHENLIRLTEVVGPHIGVIDGYEGMEGDGPGGGTGVPLRVAVASGDPVAADAVMAKIMGFEPLEIGHLYYANERGIGIADLRRIEILGNGIEEVRRPFKPHSNYETQRKWRRS